MATTKPTKQREGRNIPSETEAKSRAWAFLTRAEALALEARAEAEGLRASEITLRAIRGYLATPLPSATEASLSHLAPGLPDSAATVSRSPETGSMIAAAYIEQIARAAASIERVVAILDTKIPAVILMQEAHTETKDNLAAIADGIGVVAADISVRYRLLENWSDDGQP